MNDPHGLDPDDCPDDCPDDGPSMEPWPAEMCKAMIERSPWPMFVLDCESRCVLEANDAAVTRYQMSLEDLRARGVDEVLPPHRRAELNRLLDARLDGPPHDTYSEHILPDLTLLPVEVRSFPLLWNDRPARFCIVRELLSRPSIGRDPELAERFDFGGGVSGSVAHDFNNLLTVILAVAEQLQEGEGDPEQKIGLIARTVRNAQDLARQRLTLGGNRIARREKLDLNALLSEQSDMLRILLGKQVELVTDFDQELWPVFADADQWREVVLNLAVNARDAMQDGGKLYISTTRQSLESEDAELGLTRGHYARLTVRDTGHGMTEETRQHAFKPYFSTKSRSKNSGLGLTSVYAVVQQSGGSIRLTSAPSEGTRFDIYIPAQAEDPLAGPATGLVLLVEDSDELRRMIQDFLAARGYEVIACGSAEVALKWSRSLTRKLDVVICDLILPDLPGDLLVAQLREKNPETKVIFMSGQRDGAGGIAAAEEYVPDATCLEKPFSLHQLASALAEALDKAMPAAGS
jgi:two-component system, cell cycle sensor histidine kinase and response regulator CckA